jgi:hypothetical protein
MLDRFHQWKKRRKVHDAGRVGIAKFHSARGDEGRHAKR